MKKLCAGYILVFSMLTLAGLTAMATYLVTRASVYVPFVRVVIDREKAKLVALGGVQVAMAQLARTALLDEKSSEAQESQDKAKSGTKSGAESAAPTNTQGQAQPEKQAGGVLKEEKYFLTNFLPVINRWQEYELKEEIEGIDSTLRICLMCEEGKININQIYNYAQKQFYGKGQAAGDWEKILQDMFKQIERIQGGKDLFKAFEVFLKKQEYKLLDPTQLLLIPEFEIFRRHQFYNPPSLKSKNSNNINTDAGRAEDGPQDGVRIYLTDIFTVESGKKTVNPWALSAAITELLQLKNINMEDKKELADRVQEAVKNLKQPIVWKNDWASLLKPMYQKELQSLPKGIESVFDTSTTPRIFSVISQARVGSTMQKLFVILERTKKVNKGKTNYAVNIKKLYWL